MVDFINGYFLALSVGNIWACSNPEDATTWPGTAVTEVSVFSDQLLALIASNELVWVFGAKRAVAYYNSGAAIFPFDVASGGFMEVGILAQFSAQRVATKSGTTVMWLGGDERGGSGIVYAANGFTPVRVSDHGFEHWMALQATVSDAVGMARQEEGHNYYDLWFPTANATWTLDADLGTWSKRSSLINGLPSAHLARCHTFNFGLHLVGDRTSGNVYSMSRKYFSDMTGPGISTPIVRTRIGPTISNEGGQIPVAINEFQVDFQTGVGRNRRCSMATASRAIRWRFFPTRKTSARPGRRIASSLAESRTVRTGVAIDRRLGSWRSWTPKVVVSDPIDWSIADAYVNGTQDQKKRWAKSIAEVS